MAITLPPSRILGDSGHVTDHATIRTALSDLDTAVAAKAPLASPAFTGTPTLGGTAWGLPGLTYITKADFSSATSVSLNNCFTSTYDNYLLLVNHGTVASNGNLVFRMRYLGTDENGANYATTGTYTNEAGGPNRAASVSATSARLGDCASTTTHFTAATFYGPAVATRTFYVAQNVLAAAASGVAQVNYSGHHNNANAYDGISLIWASATNGTVRIYGYKNS